MVAALPTSPVPEKLQELQMEAVQSLLGLSSVTGSGGQSAWAHWEHSGRSREDAVVRKRLAGGDVNKSRLRVPAPLFDLLFGNSPKVVLQAATTNVGHFIAAACLGRKGYLLQGAAVQQLLSDLGAETGDVLVFNNKGATPDGTPIALCTVAKGEGGAPAARAATCSAAGSPASLSALALPPAAAASPYGVTPSPVVPTGVGHLDWTSDEEGEGQLLVRGRAARHGEGNDSVAPCTVSAAEGGGVVGQTGSGGDATSAGVCETQHGSGAGGGDVDHDTAAAAATLTAAVADDGEVETAAGGGDDAADPEWHARPKARGRPRKRRPSGAAAAAVAQKQRQGDTGELYCAHCGTSDTPRWWKDNFPMGTLCNACGIWLKRHGYPRPVQFFVQPGTNGPCPRLKVPARRDDGPSGASSSRLVEASPPPDVEFYLINGRPKRRRAPPGPPPPLAPSSSNADAGGVRVEAAQSELVQAASDPGINFEAAGGRVFVVRRKLIKGEDGGGPAAALVHFGWAPSARAAHEMYDKVVQYGERSAEVTVDDYELLTDCKATATLQLRPGKSVTSWDGLVRDFVDSL